MSMYDTSECEFEYEVEEMDLASELLEVRSDEEMDYFLGKLISKASKHVRNFAHSSTGQALKGILKQAAKKALPVVGGAVGGKIGGAKGAQLGRQLGSRLGAAFGLELEGLSPEDQEFEAAKRFVRFAATAAKKAAAAQPGKPPIAIAKAAVNVASRRHAPGLHMDVIKAGARNQGAWIRRGNTIVLMDV